MQTRNKGQYNPGFYTVSSDSSSDLIQVEFNEENNNQLKDFINEMKYEILDSLKYKRKQTPHCRLRIKCNVEVGNQLITNYNLNRARYKVVENFLHDHEIILRRKISEGNFVQIKSNTFKMKYLPRKPLQLDDMQVVSNQMFICLEYFREQVIIRED
jgi:hypothetical protein